MGFRIISKHTTRKCSGPFGGGFFLIVFAIFGWVASGMIFPKIPGYKDTLSKGEIVEGRITKVENVKSIKINSRSPQRVFYSYHDTKQGSMILAMDQKAQKGASVTLRVLGENAYPEDLKPFTRPAWVPAAAIIILLLGLFFLGMGILRFLLLGGALVVGLRALLGGRSSGQP